MPKFGHSPHSGTLNISASCRYPPVRSTYFFVRLALKLRLVNDEGPQYRSSLEGFSPSLLRPVAERKEQPNGRTSRGRNTGGRLNGRTHLQYELGSACAAPSSILRASTSAG
jgi:hypothetical protein